MTGRAWHPAQWERWEAHAGAAAEEAARIDARAAADAARIDTLRRVDPALVEAAERRSCLIAIEYLRDAVVPGTLTPAEETELADALATADRRGWSGTVAGPVRWWADPLTPPPTAIGAAAGARDGPEEDDRERCAALDAERRCGDE